MIGCYMDLGRREVWFSKNGATVSGVLRLPHFDDDVITPAISMSSNVRYRLLYTVFCVTACEYILDDKWSGFE